MKGDPAICCVPQCHTDSWKCDPSITFHDFPLSPDLAAKWIKQINSAVHLKYEPIWLPKGNSVICSKHFLSTDFKDDTDTLKPRVVPTVFGSKYIGKNAGLEKTEPIKQNTDNAGPLIVKIKTQENVNNSIVISEACSLAKELEAVLNEPDNETTNDIQSTSNSNEIPQATTSIQSTSNSNEIPQTTANITNVIKPNLKSKNTMHKNKTLGVKDKVIKKKKPSTNNKNVQKRDNKDNLIEIGPNTFLKINPDIIKVNKKLTPSGNTVLQFLMDQNLANTIGADVLPKIVQGAISNINNATSNVMKSNSNNDTVDYPTPTESTKDTEPKKGPVVQRVLGHIVDTHVCQEDCSDLQEIDNVLTGSTDIEENKALFKNVSNFSGNSNNKTKINLTKNKSLVNSDSLIETTHLTELKNGETSNEPEKTDSACIEKAPVLLTTNMSLAHCFMEKTKYLNNLRQKSRQIATLKQKVSLLNKKIEELEDKCVVQERQLSFAFLKKLRAVRKNAGKGDPAATYILEQVRAYSGQKQMRWSDSTLYQCAVWCRKAPYAYEYFKKADFFKLPCLGTVKRFIKKHPEISFTNKTNPNIERNDDDDDESSSDFDFDEESLNGDNENHHENIECEAILTEETSNCGQSSFDKRRKTIPDDNEMEIEQSSTEETAVQNVKVENISATDSFPITVDGANLEIQELILPSGEVVQCYSSNNTETGNQYFIIPNAGDQDSGMEQEYSIVQSSDSVPVILQNIERSQLHQDQLILITDSTDQVECSETEIITDR